MGFTLVNGGDPPLTMVLVWTKSILNTERFEKDGVAIPVRDYPKCQVIEFTGPRSMLRIVEAKAFDNYKGCPIYMDKFSNYVKFHKNQLQTHENIGPKLANHFHSHISL